MTHHGLSISIVIPAYNEGLAIASTIKDIESFVRDRFDSAEIIVVNDGSSDDTAKIAESMRHAFADSGLVTLNILDHEKRSGKGHAVRNGVLRASKQFILMTDADLSTPIDELETLLDRILRGADIAIASRHVKGARITVKQPLFRRVLGRIYNFLVRRLVVAGYRDTQCGFKLFRADAARDIFSRCVLNGFSFDVEMLYLAGKRGYAVAEAPVAWINKSPESKVTIRSDYVAMLTDLFRISRLHHRREYHD